MGTKEVLGMLLSPRFVVDSQFVTGAADLAVHKVTTAKVVHRLKVTGSAADTVAWSPDGSRTAVSRAV